MPFYIAHPLHALISSPVTKTYHAVKFVTLRPCLVPKKFQDSPLHLIFGHMYEALNVVLKNKQLHSLAVNNEMNLLSLISP